MSIIESPIDTIQELEEKGISFLYSAFFRMRKSEQYQREYDSINILIHMLSEDKMILLQKYRDKINV